MTVSYSVFTDRNGKLAIGDFKSEIKEPGLNIACVASTTFDTNQTRYWSRNLKAEDLQGGMEKWSRAIISPKWGSRQITR
jgi:hypothetical protein